MNEIEMINAGYNITSGITKPAALAPWIWNGRYPTPGWNLPALPKSPEKIKRVLSQTEQDFCDVTKAGIKGIFYLIAGPIAIVTLFAAMSSLLGGLFTVLHIVGLM